MFAGWLILPELILRDGDPVPARCCSCAMVWHACCIVFISPGTWWQNNYVYVFNRPSIDQDLAKEMRINTLRGRTYGIHSVHRVSI